MNRNQIDPNSLPRIPGFPKYSFNIATGDVFSFHKAAEGKKIGYDHEGRKGEKIYNLWHEGQSIYMSVKQIEDAITRPDAHVILVTIHQGNAEAVRVQNQTQQTGSNEFIVTRLNEKGIPQFADKPYIHTEEGNAARECERMAKATGFVFAYFKKVAQCKADAVKWS